MSTGTAGKKRRRHSGEPVADSEEHFPTCKRFTPPTQLSTFKGIIGRIRYLTSGGKNNKAKREAIREVSKEIKTSFCNATVYCLELRTIKKNVIKLFEEFKVGRKIFAMGDKDKNGNNVADVIRYKDLIAKKDRLFDCSTDDPARREKCAHI